ncbi:MAG: glycoside hydrolase family 9 protein, partial [Candidatus Lokiarchaeota archaeon]|nr:glycoside hydrolase family 9 protein [Candidatus Lokiarchaeota archaeon]
MKIYKKLILKKKKSIKAKGFLYAFFFVLIIFLSTFLGVFYQLLSINPFNEYKNYENEDLYLKNAYWNPPEEDWDNYYAALQKAIYFYKQQKSGDLDENNPVIWRGDSCLDDGIDVGLDLTGGFYDGSSNVKFGLPIASTVATLAWAIYEYENAFFDTNQLEELNNTIKWATDYFIKCHSTPNEFYFQVGDIIQDEQIWAPVEIIEELLSRPAFKVNSTHGGSSVCGATAAALTFASIIFNNSNYEYANICLNHAIGLYNLAWTAQSDIYYNSIVGSKYNTQNEFWDELSTAGVLLYVKTNDSIYLNDALLSSYHWEKEQGEEQYWKYKSTHSWNDMHYMAQIFLARLTHNQTFVQSIERNLDWWINGISYTEGGLAYFNNFGEGFLKFSANAAYLSFVWSDDPLCTPLNISIYSNFGQNQINYILGNNPRNSSYICGFGINPPINPQHSTAHGSWGNNHNQYPNETRHVLYGALISGPDLNDNFNDDRTSNYNKVALDYNSGLIGALAKMSLLFGGEIHNNFPIAWFKPQEERLLEYYSYANINSNQPTSTVIHIDIINHGSWPAQIKDKLSYRYFLNLSELFTAGYTIDNLSISFNYVDPWANASLSELYHYYNDIYYIIVDLSGTRIFPGGLDKCFVQTEILFNLIPNDPSGWDPTNDWSFQNLTLNENRITKFIPLFDNGILLYGIEPLADTIPPDPPTGLITTPISEYQIDLD